LSSVGRGRNWRGGRSAFGLQFFGFRPSGGYGLPGDRERPRPWFVPIVETLEAARQIDAIVAFLKTLTDKGME